MNFKGHAKYKLIVFKNSNDYHSIKENMIWFKFKLKINSYNNPTFHSYHFLLSSTTKYNINMIETKNDEKY